MSAGYWMILMLSLFKALRLSLSWRFCFLLLCKNLNNSDITSASSHSCPQLWTVLIKSEKSRRDRWWKHDNKEISDFLCLASADFLQMTLTLMKFFWLLAFLITSEGLLDKRMIKLLKRRPLWRAFASHQLQILLVRARWLLGLCRKRQWQNTGAIWTWRQIITASWGNVLQAC